MAKNSSKKYKLSVGDLVSDIKKDIESSSINKKMSIPDILTFIYDPYYLGLAAKNPPVKLFPAQEIVFKTFYRGSIGNEHLTLTQEEIDYCKRVGLDNPENGNILEKWGNSTIFKELVLVWGRRSGKDFCVSIIALYEAMKLLEAPNGNPHAYYNISTGGNISILTIANSAQQAGVAFDFIKERMMASPYFSDKFIATGIKKTNIFLTTPLDREENKQREKQQIGLKEGSVVIEVGHSNSDTLRGKSCFVLILDEVAMFKETGGSSSGDVIYSAMRPSMTAFVRKEPLLDDLGNVVLDEKGVPQTKNVYDAKIISISTPLGEDGIFWKTYKEGQTKSNILIQKLPTWIVNPNHTEKSLREESSGISEEQFRSEFGAEFSGTAGENMFPRENVEKCFTYGLKPVEYGEPGRVYFVHLDPAGSSHNYALVVVHKELFFNKETRLTDYYLAVDHVKCWSPTPGHPVKVEDVEEHLVQLKRKFHIGLVTFDSWNSQRSTMLLRKHGLPFKETPYGPRYQRKIYDELYNLIVAGKLRMPMIGILRNELLGLQRKYTPVGYKVFASPTGDTRTDDVADALAGACYMATESMTNKLPASRLVNMGTSPSGNSMQWNSMSGPIGFGTGQQVSSNLEKRNSWPNSRR